MVILLIPISLAQSIGVYGIDITLDKNGRSSVKLTMTFFEQAKELKLTIFGKVENLNATSNVGSVSCVPKITEASLITCSLDLTSEGGMVEIYFETNDFVKKLEDKFYFDGDFSLNKNISQVSSFLRLPEGMVLARETEAIFPKATIAATPEGRKIVVNWNLNNVSSEQPLRFKVLYEPVQPFSSPYLRLRYIILVGVIIVAATTLFVIRHLRKPEEVVLSVLDEFERKVMNVIVASGGKVNQKRVVHETNLSKAKVSRVVKSLVNRGLIEVERVGRTNKLKMVRKKFKYF
jgi:predicted transcriptional regulator